MKKLHWQERAYLYKYLSLVTVGILAPIIFANAYQRHLMVMTLIFAILALSLDVIIGHMGQFSFGHQAFFGFGAYSTAILTVEHGVPPWVGFFTGIVLSALLGLLVGIVSLRKSRGLYFAIITLGFGKILWFLATNWFSVTGGITGIPLIPVLELWIPMLGRITFDSEFSYYYLALGFLISAIWIIRLWKTSRFGDAVSAIRENEDLANSVGISPFKYYLGAFTFSCGLAGFAGVAYAHYMTHVAPVSLSMHYMFWMLVMVIVGGMRTYSGPIVGSFIFVFMPELLSFAKELRMVLFGLIILACITYMRRGIMPSLFSWYRRIYLGTRGSKKKLGTLQS